VQQTKWRKPDEKLGLEQHAEIRKSTNNALGGKLEPPKLEP
jgi:hypothetical protein